MTQADGMFRRVALAGCIVALGAFAPSGGVHAQTPDNVTPEQAIRFLDKDGDGACSLQEYLGFQVTRMAQFDASGDGALSQSEFRESLQGEGRKNADRSFRAFNNEDKPRALTQREFLGYHAYVFKNFVDTNKDGFMSGEEWAKLMGR